jgi:ABC-2 type transport system permease protein
MRRFFAGYLAELALLVQLRRFRILILLFLAASWAGMDIYHHQVVSDLPVAVLDLDNSRLSRTVRLALGSTRDVRLVDEVPASEEAAHDLLASGRLAAVVLIPGDFSSEIKHGRPGRVLTAVDMSNILVGKTASRAITKVLATVAVGTEIATLQKGGYRPEAALGRMAPIVVDDSFQHNPTTSYAVYLAPTLLFFFLHVFVLILACSLFLPPWRSSSTVELAGRLAALEVVGFGFGLMLAYLYLPRQGIAPQSAFVVPLAAIALFVLADLLFAALLASVVPSAFLAFQITLVVGMLSLMLSGATWPRDAFPPILRWASAAIPFTPFARALRGFLHQPATFADLGPALSQLGVQALAFAGVIVAVSLLRRLAARFGRRAMPC